MAQITTPTPTAGAAGTWPVRALALGTVAALVAYVGWRITTLGGGSRLWLSVPLLVTEAWALAAFAAFIATTWHRPARAAPAPADAGAFPRVDVVVDAAGASRDDLERTLVGLTGLRGAGRVQVAVADDDTELDDVAAGFGATTCPATVADEAMALPPLVTARSPLVLWLQAGQITMPELLEATVPHLDDERVAVCQVAVGWLNADSLAHMRGGRDQDALTRRVVGPTLAAVGAAPWTGPGSLVRTASVRNLEEASLTSPDAARSAVLGAGHTIVYEPRELVRGLAPDSLADYLGRRRLRTAMAWRAAWGRGGALRPSGGPARARLEPLGRLLAATAGLRLLIQLSLACAVIVSGVMPFVGSAVGIGGLWAGLALLTSLARRTIAGDAMGIGDWVRQGWRTLPADAPALLGRSARPAADDDSGARPRLLRVLGTLWPLSLAILALDAALLARGWTLISPDALPRLGTSERVMVLLWGLVLLVPLVDVVQVTALRRQRRKDPRLETSLPITVGDITGRTRDISPGGVGLVLDAAPAVGSNATFELTLPGLDGGTQHIRGLAVVRSATADPSGRVRVGLEFVNLSTPARLALVGYCGIGHAIDFVDRRPLDITPVHLDVNDGVGHRPVKGVTGLAAVAGVAVLIAGPTAGVALATAATGAVTEVCVVSVTGEPVDGAIVSRLVTDGEELLGTTDGSGCVAVAPLDAPTAYRTEAAGLDAMAGSEGAVDGTVTITLRGRSVTVLDATGELLDVELRTFADGWSEAQPIAGTTTLPPDGAIEAVEIRWSGASHVAQLDGDVVLVLAVLRADAGARIVEIDRGAGWEPFVDGMQTLPGRLAVRLDDETVVKLEVPGDHEMMLPSGRIGRLDMTPAPTPLPTEEPGS